MLFVVSGSWLVFAALWPHRRDRYLTSQTAKGGQLPYKGSLGRPAVIFDHSLFRMMVRGSWDCSLLAASRGAHVGRPFGIMVYPSYMTGNAGKHAHISAYVMLT